MTQRPVRGFFLNSGMSVGVLVYLTVGPPLLVLGEKPLA
jgi:hypothetical protein